MSDTKAKLMELTKSVLADKLIEVSAGNASLREGIDVEIVKTSQMAEELDHVKDELAQLKSELEQKLIPGEPTDLLGLKGVVDLLRPFASTDTLQRVNMMKMRDNEGIDVGVRVIALRAACGFMAAFDAMVVE